MGLSSELSCEAGSFPYHHNPHRFLQSEILRLYFPTLEPWVARSVLLPNCSFLFNCMQMWDHLVHQPPPCPFWASSCHLAMSPLRPSFPSLPLLPIWMIVSSLTPWMSDFHKVQFSGSSGVFFLFLNLLLSFFWLCKEVNCIYLHLHLGQSPCILISHWALQII